MCPLRESNPQRIAWGVIIEPRILLKSTVNLNLTNGTVTKPGHTPHCNTNN